MQVSAALGHLDAAAASAAEAGVSAKYAKKVLKRLQRQLDAILAPEVPAAAPVQPEPGMQCSIVQQAEQPQSSSMPEARQGKAQAVERPGSSGIDIQLPVQAESKGQGAHVLKHHPPVSPPASTSGPPGFGKAPQQQGRTAVPPVKAVSVAAEPAASQQKPPVPNVPPAWAAPLPRQVSSLSLAQLLKFLVRLPCSWGAGSPICLHGAWCHAHGKVLNMGTPRFRAPGGQYSSW